MNGIIYLASWPRSGNTLLRAILWQCFGLESCSMNSEDSMFIRNPDWHRLTGAIRFPHKMKDVQEIIGRQGVALFKTHDQPGAISPESRVIYLVRDGREACVSYWHYYRDILEDSTMTLERIIRGDCLFGSWSEHLRVWCRASATISRALLLQYEDVLADAMHTQSPLNIHHSTGVRKEDVFIALARFVGAHRIRPDIHSWQDFHDSDPQFFRSGTNETWKTEMTGDDLALFDKLHGDTMREYGYYPAKEPKCECCSVYMDTN